MRAWKGTVGNRLIREALAEEDKSAARRFEMSSFKPTSTIHLYPTACTRVLEHSLVFAKNASASRCSAEVLAKYSAHGGTVSLAKKTGE